MFLFSAFFFVYLLRAVD